jgi:hypothetical protein
MDFITHVQTRLTEVLLNIIAQRFPHAIQLVDWYHACEYLTPGTAWAGKTVDQVITACTPFIRPDLKPDDDPAQQAVRFFTHQRHRLDYPTYRTEGYPMGSGTMESACKQLGLERLKIAGRVGDRTVKAPAGLLKPVLRI